MGVGGVPNSFTREAALLREHHQSVNDDQLRTLGYIPLSSKSEPHRAESLRLFADSLSG